MKSQSEIPTPILIGLYTEKIVRMLLVWVIASLAGVLLWSGGQLMSVVRWLMGATKDRKFIPALDLLEVDTNNERK